jgi:hypothetical protein
VARSQQISKRTQNRISDLIFFDRHQHERAPCNYDLAQSSYIRSRHARPLPPRPFPLTNYARSHPKRIPEASTRSEYRTSYFSIAINMNEHPATTTSPNPPMHTYLRSHHARPLPPRASDSTMRPLHLRFHDKGLRNEISWCSRDYCFYCAYRTTTASTAASTTASTAAFKTRVCATTTSGAILTRDDQSTCQLKLSKTNKAPTTTDEVIMTVLEDQRKSVCHFCMLASS